MKQFLIFLLAGTLAFSQGIIRGKVLDADTKQPLYGANVMVENTELGAATDENGRFEIRQVPVGTHHLKIGMMGYEMRTLLNLSVTTARPISVTVELVPTEIEMDALTVSAKAENAFTRSSSSTVSTMHIDNAEIRSDPGGAWDIQRVVQSLPSVSTASDQENEIISRGGYPGENLFILDGIEIQNPNHFGFEGQGGGPINMINNLFVREVEFTPGAFSAKYGDKASSVMDIVLRDGSREQFETDLELSMAGAGVNSEGPLFGGRGSFLASSRWSYLDLVIKSAGMTAVPKYNNHQTKLIYDLSPRTKLIFNELMAQDEIHIEAENDVVSRGAESVDWDSQTYVGGIGLRRLLGKFGYGLTTISGVRTVYHFGEPENPYFTRDTRVDKYALKSDWVLKFSFGEIATGYQLKMADFDYNTWNAENLPKIYDTTYWNEENQIWNYEDYGLTEDDLIVADDSSSRYAPEWTFDSTGTEWKSGAYLQWKAKFGPKKRGKIILGARNDYFSATEERVISSRVNVQFLPNPITTLHFAYGRHYQFPDYFMVLRNEKNSEMKSKFTDQFVVGLERFFDRDFRGSVEAFYKTYSQIPTLYYWTNPPENYPEESLEHINHWINEGSGEAFGVEFFLQKKLFDKWHGIFSYAWSHARMKNYRNLYADIGNNGTMDTDWVDSDFDYRHQLTLIGGYKHKFKKAEEIEISFRLGYNSGRPHSKMEYVPEWRDWQMTEHNSERFPEYHRLDVMLIHRKSFKRLNLVSYVDVMNIFNHDNIWDFAYNPDGTKEDVWQYKTMPIGGVRLEF